MSLPQIHPLLLDEMIVLISGTFMECFSTDEQAVIGTFLATLGSVISLNSVYLLYVQGLTQETGQEIKDEDNKYEILEKSIDKIKEEIQKLKDSKH